MSNEKQLLATAKQIIESRANTLRVEAMELERKSREINLDTQDHTMELLSARTVLTEMAEKGFAACLMRF